jgi:hypothetical protein
MKSAFKVLQLIIFSSAIGSWQVEANASLFITSRSNRRTSCLKRKNTADDNDEKTWSFNNKSLTKRITEVQASESVFVSGLQRRVDKIVKADELDAAMSMKDENNNIIVDMPVVTMDALLPNQRLTGSTTDPTFCNLLRSLGLGGSFVMTSINNRQRRIRRFGVVAKIELVDVDDDNESESFSPTSVTFDIVGTRRCEIIGKSELMKQRIGRWRRAYDPDGEESRLGWGPESFVNKADAKTSFDVTDTTENSQSDTQWSNCRISIIDDDEEERRETESFEKATQINKLIDHWLILASDQTTYDNVDVVARTRRKAGQPGLTVNASVLLKRVQHELGTRPPPERPTLLALWGAALLNPLPPLGVATELRGAVLEADGALMKLSILERGLLKSIDNLDGTRPLNM